MPTEVIVAIIAVGGVVFAQGAAYGISRLSANDLRVNIDREIDILRKLAQDSRVAKRLEGHIGASIEKLVGRDERREQLTDAISKTAPLALMSFTLYYLSLWRAHGIPDVLRVPVETVYWAVFSILAARAVEAVWVTTALIYRSMASWIPISRKKSEIKRSIKAAHNRREADLKQMHQLKTLTEQHRDQILGAEGGEDIWNRLQQAFVEFDHADGEASANLANLRQDLKRINFKRHVLSHRDP